MKRYILFIIFLNVSVLIKSNIYINFLHQGQYYTVKPISNKIIDIEQFDPLKIVDQSQKHRFLITSLEKSRLASLFYLGDNYQFNSVRLELIAVGFYKIEDLENKISIKFRIGKFDNIVISSIIKFSDNEIINKIASALTVKILLKKMNGIIEGTKKEFSNKGISSKEIESEFKKFIDELKKKRGEEILYYLTRFAELNFELDISQKSLSNDWINPVDLYFYKKGDYKSFTFFYYYLLKESGYNAKLYLVTPLIKKDKNELNELYDLFSNRKNPEYRNKIEILEMDYNRVNQKKIVKDFSDNYIVSTRNRPPSIFFYKPPDFEKSTLIATVKIGEAWIYTTGTKWIKTGAIEPDWVCYNYSNGKCYYTEIDSTILETLIFNNLPVTERDIDIIWDIYF